MNKWKAVSLLLVMACGLSVPGPVWGAAGDQLWETPFTFLPQYNTITVNYTTLSATRYIVSGYAKNSDGAGGQVGFIKAFDVVTGDIKWEHTLTIGATGNGFGVIMINGDLALVRGSYGSSSGSPPIFTLFKNFIRAYNTDDGQLVWEVLLDFEAAPNTTPRALNPAPIANNRVFTCFTSVNSSGVPEGGKVFARAYQLRNVALQTMLLLN
jgi:hypothetical protein